MPAKRGRPPKTQSRQPKPTATTSADENTRASPRPTRGRVAVPGRGRGLKRSISLPDAVGTGRRINTKKGPLIIGGKTVRRPAAYSFYLKEAIPRVKNQLGPDVSHSTVLSQAALEWKTVGDKSQWMQLAEEATQKLEAAARPLSLPGAIQNNGEGALVKEEEERIDLGGEKSSQGEREVEEAVMVERGIEGEGLDEYDGDEEDGDELNEWVDVEDSSSIKTHPPRD